LILIFYSFLKTKFIANKVSSVYLFFYFDKVKNCILKSLIDHGSSISFDEEELNMIHNLVTTLEPVKFAVEALCLRDATL
jgi:hypothetical protein